VKAAQVRGWFADEVSGIKDRWQRLPSGGKAALGLIAVLLVIAMVVLAVVAVVNRETKVDTVAYRDALVSVDGGDLPAPNFVGWSAMVREEPPVVPQPDEAITGASPEECTPGGELHQKTQKVLLDGITQWSGETLNLLAYNAMMAIDIANPKHYELTAIDAWTKQCSRSRFVKDGVEHVQKVQTLPVDRGQWSMADSRVYAVTLTRLRDGANLGTTSTLYVVSTTGDVVAQGALTIRGSLDDNAITTLNLLWDKQTVKLTRFLAS